MGIVDWAQSLTFINWWMPLAAALVIAAVIVVLTLKARRSRASDTPSLPIAHGDRLTELPRYRAAIRRYRILLVAGLSLVLVSLLASVTLASRPATPEVSQQDLATRDIVLCLDVSGSMIDYDAQIVRVFSELSEQFTGERISLVLFNASAVTYFPLSTDYAYIQRQLDALATAFDTDDTSIYSGTLLGDGSSLIGDGLASCALRFDTPEADRSRSIIFATDNVLAGTSIYTLPQAGELAAQGGIRVYGVNPGDTTAREYLSELAVEFESVVEATGGTYYPLDDPSAIPTIVDSITAEQAQALPGSPELILADAPTWPFAILLIGVAGYFVVAWRIRR